MKKLLAILGILLFFTTAYAKASRPLVELEPKANLYIGSVRFGLGCDVIVNPLKTIGFRFSGTELSFGDDYTQFYINFTYLNSSLDALFYFPMRGMQPYVHAGIGFLMLDTEAGGSNTSFTLRGGLGLNYPWSSKAKLFVEPGVIITDLGEYSDTDVIFRLSAGARFGILK
jgi:hypothetical protein